MIKTQAKPKAIPKTKHGHIEETSGGGYIVETGHSGGSEGPWTPPTKTPFEKGHGHMAMAHLAKHMGVKHDVEDEAAEEAAEPKLQKAG